MDPYRDAPVDAAAELLSPDELADLRRRRRGSWLWALFGWILYFVPVAALSPILVLPIALLSHRYGAWIGESIGLLFTAAVATFHIGSVTSALRALGADIAAGRAEVVLEQRRRVADRPPGLYRVRRVPHSGEVLSDELVEAARESSDDPTARRRQQEDLDAALEADAATRASNAAGRLTDAQRRRCRSDAWSPTLVGGVALLVCAIGCPVAAGWARLLLLLPLAVAVMAAFDARPHWRDALGGAAITIAGQVDKQRLYLSRGRSAYWLKMSDGLHELPRAASDALVLLDLPYRVHCARATGKVLSIEPGEP